MIRCPLFAFKIEVERTGGSDMKSIRSDYLIIDLSHAELLKFRVDHEQRHGAMGPRPAGLSVSYANRISTC